MYDQFAAKFVDAVRAFSVGEGTGEGITHGPLIHQAALDKVGRHVEDAKSKGAKVLVGGARLDGPGFFYQVRASRVRGSKADGTQPTVLGEAQRCAIDEDETFGPVAALYRFKTEEEVIAHANEPSVGLAAYVAPLLPCRTTQVPSWRTTELTFVAQVLLLRIHLARRPRFGGFGSRNGKTFFYLFHPPLHMTSSRRSEPTQAPSRRLRSRSVESGNRGSVAKVRSFLPSDFGRGIDEPLLLGSKYGLAEYQTIKRELASSFREWRVLMLGTVVAIGGM